MTSDEARYLQSFLSRYKDIYPEGLITGWFGPLTRSAVQRFQCKYAILCDPNDPAHGYVGPRTRERLNELLREPLTGSTGSPQADNSPLTPSLTSSIPTSDNGGITRYTAPPSFSRRNQAYPGEVERTPIPAYRDPQSARGEVEESERLLGIRAGWFN